MAFNSFDFDGVIDFEGEPGIYPGPQDVIITGRSIDELPETDQILINRGIQNLIYYNPISFEEKTREKSAKHKVETINKLRQMGFVHRFHFDDDSLQIAIMESIDPSIKVIYVKSDIVELENKRRN